MKLFGLGNLGNTLFGGSVGYMQQEKRSKTIKPGKWTPHDVVNA